MNKIDMYNFSREECLLICRACECATDYWQAHIQEYWDDAAEGEPDDVAEAKRECERGRALRDEYSSFGARLKAMLREATNVL